MSKIFMLLFCLAFLVSCRITEPQYVSYTPAPDSQLHIVFEYPKDWDWKFFPQDAEGSGSIIGVFADPNDYTKGSLFLSVHIENTSESDYYQDTNNRLQGFTLNSELYALEEDAQILLNDLPARKVVIRGKGRPRENNYEEFYKELIFIHVDDRSYEIIFEIPVKNRDSFFGKAFDHLIDTLKVLR